MTLLQDQSAKDISCKMAWCNPRLLFNVLDSRVAVVLQVFARSFHNATFIAWGMNAPGTHIIMAILR